MCSWLRTRQQTPVEERKVRALRFLGEQDGEPERELKAAWAATLANTKGVTRAFLARAISGDSAGPAVMLCICPSSVESAALVQQLAAPFQSIFGANQFVDIVFLSAVQEADVSRVATPFFPQPNKSLERTREG